MNTLAASPDLVRQFTGHHVLCLHAICQPLVDDMQTVILHQRDQLERAVKAMEYSISRQRDNLLGSQQFTNLTAIIAEIKNEDVDIVREGYIPGSAKMHREENNR